MKFKFVEKVKAKLYIFYLSGHMLCPHDRSIINECARIILAKSDLIWPWMTFEVILLLVLTFLKSFLNKKYIAEKDDFEI